MSRRPKRRKFVSRKAQEAVELLTPREIAQRLGWPEAYDDERLKRIVFAAERRNGVEIFVRMGSPEHPAYSATMGAIRKWIPQLFDRSKLEALSLDVRKYIGQIEGRVLGQIADHVAESVEPTIDAIRADLKAVRVRQSTLDSRLAVVEQRLGITRV